MTEIQIKEAAIFAENNRQWLDAAFLYDQMSDTETTVESLSRAGWCYSRAAEYEKAIDRFLSVLELEPNMAKWYYMIGYQHYCMKSWRVAVDWFEKSLEKYPRYLVVKYRLGYAYLQIAGNYLKLTKPEFWRALGQFQECVSLWNEFSEEERVKNKDTIANIFFQFGKATIALNNKIDDSIKYLKLALSLREDNYIKYELAKAYYVKKEFEESLKTLPNSREYYVEELRCQILFELTRYDEALSILDSVFNKRKKEYLYILKSCILRNMGKSKEAYQVIKEAMMIFKPNHKILLEVSQVLLSMNVLFEAKKFAEEAINLRRMNFQLSYDDAYKVLEVINEKLLNHINDDLTQLILPVQIKNQGTIKNYNSEKGYGFIQFSDKDLFFHISDCCMKDVRIGKNVTFEIKEGKKGFQAIKVTYL